jgi:hypothetical protein
MPEYCGCGEIGLRPLLSDEFLLLWRLGKTPAFLVPDGLAECVRFDSLVCRGTSCNVFRLFPTRSWGTCAVYVSGTQIYHDLGFGIEGA